MNSLEKFLQKNDDDLNVRTNLKIPSRVSDSIQCLTTLDKVQEIISITSIIYKDDVYLRKKLEELKQQVINQINVNIK
jgi:hypothetical protein